MPTQADGQVPHFEKGDHVMVRDAFDKWHHAVAASGIEGTHLDGRKVHDFPVVWVWLAALPKPVKRPWPYEDVRMAPPPVPDDPAEWAAELERLRRLVGRDHA